METEISIGLRVELKRAEQVKMYLTKNNLLRKDLKIKKDKEFIYFPTKEDVKYIDSCKSYIIPSKFQKEKIKSRSYKDIINVPEELRQELPTSYDILGDIALIKLTNNILKYKNEVGKSLLASNKNINVVCLVKPVSGELRTRNIEIIAGDLRTDTIHKEYGLSFKLDIEKTYFSSRLATERMRIAKIVKQDEIILDMFSGVAPFSIMIAKYANPKIIYAVDKNRDAIKFAKQNIKINNVLDKIELIHSDIRNIRQFLNGDLKANRIIMNLPFSAHKFFSHALDFVANRCIIHYYDILKEGDIQLRLENLKNIAKDKKIKLEDLEIRKIKTYAPREFYMGIDIRVKKMPM